MFTAHTDREFGSSQDHGLTSINLKSDRPLDIICCDVEKSIISAQEVAKTFEAQVDLYQAMKDGHVVI